MFKITATSGTRYSSRSSIALPRFLKMPVLARTPKHIYPALAIVRGAHSQES